MQMKLLVKNSMADYGKVAAPTSVDYMFGEGCGLIGASVSSAGGPLGNIIGGAIGAHTFLTKVANRLIG